MAKQTLYVALAGGLLFLIAACGMLGEDENHTPDRDLVGTTWKLTAFEAADGTTTGVEVDSYFGDHPFYTVEFTNAEAGSDECVPDASPRGAWCLHTLGYPNEGFFSYRIASSNSVTIYFHGTTLVGTPSGSRETEFFTALREAIRYEIDGDGLTILYGDGQALHFEALEAEPE